MPWSGTPKTFILSTSISGPPRRCSGLIPGGDGQDLTSPTTPTRIPLLEASAGLSTLSAQVPAQVWVLVESPVPAWGRGLNARWGVARRMGHSPQWSMGRGPCRCVWEVRAGLRCTVRGAAGWDQACSVWIPLNPVPKPGPYSLSLLALGSHPVGLGKCFGWC